MPRSAVFNTSSFLHGLVSSDYGADEATPLYPVIVPGDIHMDHQKGSDDPHDQVVDEPDRTQIHDLEEPAAEEYPETPDMALRVKRKPREYLEEEQDEHHDI